MAQILVLSSARNDTALPALELLSHRVRVIPASPEHLVNAPDADVIFLDARQALLASKTLAQVLRTAGLASPLVAIVTEAGCAAITGEWGIDDVILDSAGPAELEARIRLAITRSQGDDDAEPGQLHLAGITVDEASYTARIDGRPLDLTYREFELLRFLASHPSRVFTREQLLSEVWGFDYFGGSRTVDVHIRRLRAKLGDLEALIGTVRNVGYRFETTHEKLDSPEARIGNT